MAVNLDNILIKIEEMGTIINNCIGMIEGVIARYNHLMFLSLQIMKEKRFNSKKNQLNKKLLIK